MSNQPQQELSARDAARRLGVKLPTLYAYVSRGLLRSLPGRTGRARRYLATYVEALRARGPSVRAAAGALRWGEPILESAITAMTPATTWHKRTTRRASCRGSYSWPSWLAPQLCC